MVVDTELYYLGITMGFFTLKGRPTIATEYKGIAECAMPGQHDAIYKVFKDVVPAGSRVLDLASGRGAWARRLMDAGYEVTACDIVPELCQVPCASADLNDSFSNRFSGFDAVSAIEMLEHIENPRHIFRECCKLLRPGAKIILSTPNASGLHSRVKFLATGRFAQFDDEQYNAIGHIRPITFWELDKMLEEAGFAIRTTTFFDHHDYFPQTLGEVVKLLASLVLKPFLSGTAGGQAIIVVAEKTN